MPLSLLFVNRSPRTRHPSHCFAQSRHRWGRRGGPYYESLRSFHGGRPGDQREPDWSL